MKFLSKGNSKLAKHVGVWNIPAGMEVCGRECVGCYAIKEQKRWKGTVVSGRNNRWEASKQPDFVEKMVAEILKSKMTMIRIHGSGEFYSQTYIDNWIKIVDLVKVKKPKTIFYAYTKRDKEFDFTKLVKRDNFILHKSLVETGGRRVMNYGKPEAMLELQHKTGGFICPLVVDRTGKCGAECTFCMEKVNEGTPVLFEAH